jgi:hypothetical protein
MVTNNTNRLPEDLMKTTSSLLLSHPELLCKLPKNLSRSSKDDLMRRFLNILEEEESQQEGQEDRCVD